MTAPPTLDLAALHRRYHRLLVRRALVILRHREDAEDAAAVVWLKLARRSTWDGSCAIGTWLYVMVTTAALDLRRNRTTRPSTDAPLAAADKKISDGPSPFEVLAAKEAFDGIAAKLGALSDDERDVLLRTVRGQSRSELATSVGIPISTVKTRLTRARRRLR